MTDSTNDPHSFVDYDDELIDDIHEQLTGARRPVELLTIELAPNEVEMLHCGLASEIARHLMAVDGILRQPERPGYKEVLEDANRNLHDLTALGRRLGMEL